MTYYMMSVADSLSDSRVHCGVNNRLSPFLVIHISCYWQYLYCNLGLGHGPFVESALTEPEETNITMIYCSNHDRLFPLFQSGEWVRSLLGQWFGGWWTKNGGEEALEKGQTRLRRRDCCSACIRGRLGCRSFDWFSVISLAFRTGKRWREFGKSIEESGEFM